MPRFFIDYAPKETACIQGADARHISRSLRMQPGETLILCDSLGTDYHCVIEALEEDAVYLKVLSSQKTEAEPSLKVTLYQGLPKSDKMDWIVQKSVELGVYQIVPVMTMRCVSRPDDRSMYKKVERWQKIAAEAAKQSGRGILPQVKDMISFREALAEAKGKGVSLLFYEGGGERISALVKAEEQEVSIFIGPEGGFDLPEVELAKEMGAVPATLGPRILRTETAPLAALAALMQTTGNL